MFKLFASSFAVLGLFCFTSMSLAQTTNINQINGNGNSIVNRTSGFSGPVTNINRINGDNNSIINRTKAAPSWPQMVGGDPSTWGPLEYPAIPQPQYVPQYQPVQYVPYQPQYVPQYQPVFVPQPMWSGVQSGMNKNINRIVGDGNQVQNISSGGMGTLNVNKITGNGNSVTNRSRP